MSPSKEYFAAAGGEILFTQPQGLYLVWVRSARASARTERTHTKYKAAKPIKSFVYRMNCGAWV